MSDGQRPDFNWLYTGKGTPPPTPGSAEPEATRVLPVSPRPAASNPASNPASAAPGAGADTPAAPPRQPPVAPPGRPPMPPRGTEYGGGPGHPRLPRRPSFKTVRRTFAVLLVAWLAYLVWVPVQAWKSVPKVDFVPSGARPAEQPGTTYLLVGSDSRAGLSAKQRKQLSTGGDVGQRTDTIMILHTGSGPNLLMSIPRDSLVPVPGHGTSKINAAFAWGGPQLLVKTIEQNTGIRIDQYAEIGLGGIVSIVDAVGGITICPTFDMKDKLAGLNIKKGCQEADGAVALGYARSRHTDPRYGDITRAQHQREVVNAVGKKVATPSSVLNPFKYWDLAHAAPKSFAFGSGASSIQAVKWAWAMTRTTGKNGSTCGVPISDLSVKWDTARAKKMFSYIKADTIKDLPAGLCTPTGLPKSVTG